MKGQDQDQGFPVEYNRTDVEAAYSYGPWSGWGELIGWLQDRGIDDPRFGPGKVDHLVNDLQRLQKDRVPFTNDPAEAHRLALAHKRPQ